MDWRPEVCSRGEVPARSTANCGLALACGGAQRLPARLPIWHATKAECQMNRPLPRQQHPCTLPRALHPCTHAALPTPTPWLAQAGFVVEGASGKVWEDVDLAEKEWVDFDDKSNESVSIMDLQWEFRRG